MLRHIPGRENYSLPANSILSLYNDQDQNIWAGSIRNGLINIQEVSMMTYTDVQPGNDQGLSNNTILSLYQESSDKIWIGTDGGGINHFNPLTEKFTHYPSTRYNKVASICGYTPDKLLISLFSQGVFVFNPSTGEKQSFTIINSETTSRLCNRGKTVNLYQNTPHTVLLLGDHVYQYDLLTHTFSIANEEEGQDIVGTLLPIANNNNHTYLSGNKRIYDLDNQNRQLKILFRCYKDTIINSASRDEYGNFWIGSNYGLNHYNPVTKVSSPIPTNLFTEITLLICDQQGKVWIGTDSMLFAWLIKEKSSSYLANRTDLSRMSIFPSLAY